METRDKGIRRIVTAGLLLAITLLLTLTRVGMIPVPTPAANATVAHIPAIIGGILEGPLVGLIVGLGFGFASFMGATIPLFKDPLVAVLPRLFIGVTASYAYIALQRASKRTLVLMVAVVLIFLLAFSFQVSKTIPWLGPVIAIVSVALAIFLYWWMQREDIRVVCLAVAAGVGSLTNTILVLSIAVLRGYFAPAAGWAIGLTHGIPEVIVAAIVTIAVVAALRQVGRRRGSRL